MSVLVCVCPRLSIFCSLLLVVLRVLRALRGSIFYPWPSVPARHASKARRAGDSVVNSFLSRFSRLGPFSPSS